MNSTTEVLQINDLRVWANHGWYAEERLIGGEYRIDVVMELNLPNRKLELADTIDYEVVVNRIHKVMKKEFKLIEESCREIFNVISSDFENIVSLHVTIEKVNIPINNLYSTSFSIKS